MPPARRRGLRFAVQPIVGAALACYALFVLVGLLPCNLSFRPSTSGVELLVSSTAIHADILMPIANDVVDWRRHFPAACFRGDTEFATHAAVGWGDRGFYLYTQRWSDLRLSTAVKALFWPTESCLHVTLTRPENLREPLRRVRVSPAEYERLVEAIQDSFVRDDQGRYCQLQGFAYATNDAFFAAHGSYHALNTCNSWAGDMLQRTGVSAPWWTPLPKTLFLYWPTSEPGEL